MLTEDEPPESGSTDPSVELGDTVVLPDVELIVWTVLFVPEEPPSANAEEL